VVCSPCKGTRRTYNPAIDLSFDRLLEELFLAHPGELVYPRRMLAVDVCYRWGVVTAVRRLRRRGMDIAGVPGGGGGYVYRPEVVTLRHR
jgi:hypothetical protein